MRRLPVYLVLDTSGSMNGEPIEAVKNGVDLTINTLRQDAGACENAYVSIVTFNNEAQQVIPLTDLASFQMVDIKASGRTALGGALKLIGECIDREVKKNAPSQKGDWRPLVFIMTDGIPTDDWQAGLNEFKKREVGFTVACAVGNEADANILKEITKDVISLETTDSEGIKKYFALISSSIKEVSRRIEDSGEETSGLDQLPPPPGELTMV